MSDLTESKKTLSPGVVERALSYAEKRKTGMPLWYVIGDTEFYGYKIKVDRRVLIPRPETEEVVSKALEFIDENSSVLDLCTGSGAIAITVQKEKNCRVTATDISEDAITLAKENADINGAKVNFVIGNLFENITEKFDVIISNPPYIKRSDMEKLDVELSFEPQNALDGGEDGLAFYRLIASLFKNYLNENGKLILECGLNQSEEICKLFTDKAEVYKDLNGIDRIVVVKT